VKIAAIQHTLRSHVRMDLAALLSAAQVASEEGARVVASPCVAGLRMSGHLLTAYVDNLRFYAPDATVLFLETNV